MIDDPRVEEQAYYRKQRGRWKRETVTCIEDDMWWKAIAVATAAHAPLSHHFNFINGTSNGVLGEYVCGKAQAIYNEFDKLLNDTAIWISTLVGGTGSAEQMSEILLLGVELNCNHAAGYKRRMFQRTETLPFSLLWFTHQPDHVDCPMRRAVAAEVLATPDENMDTTALKLKNLFRSEFLDSQQHGTCGQNLWAVIKPWYDKSKGHVGRNEGHNSLIKAICNRCRNIGLPLLSARCNMKKELGVGMRGAAKNLVSK